MFFPNLSKTRDTDHLCMFLPQASLEIWLSLLGLQAVSTPVVFGRVGVLLRT